MGFGFRQKREQDIGILCWPRLPSSSQCQLFLGPTEATTHSEREQVWAIRCWMSTCMAEAAAQRQGFLRIFYALTQNGPEDRRKTQCHGLEPGEMTEGTEWAEKMLPSFQTWDFGTGVVINLGSHTHDLHRITPQLILSAYLFFFKKILFVCLLELKLNLELCVC